MLNFAEPDFGTAVVMGADIHIDRHVSSRSVVLRPVKLYTSGNPRPHQPDKSRFDHIIAIDKIPIVHLVISFMNTATKFR